MIPVFYSKTFECFSLNFERYLVFHKKLPLDFSNFSIAMIVAKNRSRVVSKFLGSGHIQKSALFLQHSQISFVGERYQEFFHSLKFACVLIT